MSMFVAIGLIFSPVPAAAAPAAAPEEKIICRYQDDPDLGSHIAKRKRVCMRASDWKELEAINEQTQRRLQERGPGTRRTDQTFSGGPGA
jgi:hypothetical protein